MKQVQRYEDMSLRGCLQVTIEDDGDIIVCGVPGSLDDFKRNGLYQTAQFCTIGAGGGQSPHTLRALYALVEAIEMDNSERPQFR
jgi:hypothetical protein